jgi:hypothetical protein
MNTIDLTTVTLRHGSHTDAADVGINGCAMEWASYLANEPWSDKPKCVDVYIRAFMISWNDTISSDELRTKLLAPLVPLTLNTRGSDALMLRRMWLGIDWDIRVRTPAMLRLAKLESDAVALESLPEIASQAGLADARIVAQRAQKNAAAARDAARAAAWDAAGDAARDAAWAAAGATAWDAAWDAARAAARDAAGDAARDAARDAAGDAAWDAARAAARDAAGDAARDAARDAAGDAAGDAAWDAAGDAAWDAARAAAWDAAGDAAWDAARDAAWDAARDAAGDAAWDAAWDAAGDAARDAVRDRFAPTIERLQQSASDLVRRMCALTEST